MVGTVDGEDLHDLAEEVGAFGIGVPASRFSVPSDRSVAMWIAMYCRRRPACRPRSCRP